MYGCESWTVKKAECQRIDAFELVVLEKTLESPLDCKELQPVHSEGDQPWDFFGRNDAKAEAPVVWPPHVKSWLIGKDSDAGRDWGQEEKGTAEDEMAGWHHRLDGCESEWTLGVGDGQGGLACCNSWGPKESDTTEWLNWTELNGHEFEQTLGDIEGQGSLVCAIHGVAKNRTWLTAWTTPELLVLCPAQFYFILLCLDLLASFICPSRLISSNEYSLYLLQKYYYPPYHSPPTLP